MPRPDVDEVNVHAVDLGHELRERIQLGFGLPPVVRKSGEPVTVTFSNSRTDTTTDQPGTLLDMAEAAGLTPTSGCRMGICYTCKCTKKSGQVRNVLTGELSSNDEEDIRICVSTPVSNVGLAL